MSYDEFLDLPVTYINEFVENINFKNKNNIPFTEEELELQEHFIRYTKELKLQEDKTRLEYHYSLDAYEKDK
jgi:hypothetical protein